MSNQISVMIIGPVPAELEKFPNTGAMHAFTWKRVKTNATRKEFLAAVTGGHGTIQCAFIDKSGEELAGSYIFTLTALLALIAE